MSEFVGSRNINNINSIRTNQFGDADVRSVCQIIKHYHDLSGENLAFTFLGPLSNSYFPQSIRNITVNNNHYYISNNDRGLLGTLGTLPRMLSMSITESSNSSDKAGQEFIQIFENRYYTLSLSASSKYNLLQQKEDESFSKRKTNYKISDLLTTLMGISLNGEFKYLDKRNLIKYSTLLNSTHRNVDVLINILKDYFEVDFSAKYSPLTMRQMPSSVLTRLSTCEGNNLLGINTQLGKKIPMYGQHIDISINVRTYDEYDFIVSKPNFFNAVQELISYYLKNKFAFSLFVVVDINFLPQTVLSKRNNTFMLGKNICIRSKKSKGNIKIPITTIK